MNNLHKLFSTIFLSGLLLISSCADLDKENINQPDRDRVLADPDEYIAVIEGGNIDMFGALMSSWNNNLDLIADQLTTTNAVRSFWDFAEEPRKRTNNTPTWDDIFVFQQHWGAMNEAVSVANDIIRQIVINGQEVGDGGADTQRVLGASYFMRGLARAYIGYIYDQGYIVNEDTDLSTLELVSAAELIDSGVADIDRAIDIYSADANLDWNFVPATVLSSAEFVQLANAYVARMLAGKARTAAEAQSVTDWAEVKRRATAAGDFEFNPIGTDGFANFYHNWATFVWEFSGDPALEAVAGGYLPTDIKIGHLYDPTQPTSYPTASDAIVPPPTTDDQRFGTYHAYVSDFAILRADRNRALFSNLKHIRFADSQAHQNGNGTGVGTFLFTKEETDLLLAEAEYWLGNYTAAKTIIDNGARATIGGLPPLPDANPETIANAIFYEYSIQLDLCGKGIHLAQMRRHDLLQPGTPLQYPIPATELEITGLPLYNFGGTAFTSEEGTSTGTNSWTN